MRRQAARQDEGRIAVLLLTATAALASLGAIIAELGGANKAPAHLTLAAITILLSWMFTHTIFALHYAYEYYDENNRRGGGLNFPGDEPRSRDRVRLARGRSHLSEVDHGVERGSSGLCERAHRPGDGHQSQSNLTTKQISFNHDSPFRLIHLAAGSNPAHLPRIRDRGTESYSAWRQKA